MPSSPSRIRFVVLSFVCTLSLITYLDRVCISRVKEDIAYELCIGEVQMGLVFSAFLFGYMIFEVPGGWMGDRWGSRRVLTRIVLWWSVFTALTGCVYLFFFEQTVSIGPFAVNLALNSVAVLILVRFLFGCGEAGAYPNVSRVVGCWFPFRERAGAQGAVWMCARLGGAIAPIIIGVLTGLVGWRSAFLILGMVGIVWAVLFQMCFYNRPEEHPRCNEAEREWIRSGPHSMSAVEAGHGHGKVDWGRLLTSANMWAVCLAGFCVSFGWYFYPTWQPQFLKDVHGIEYGKSQWLTGLPFLCGAAGCMLGGGISDYLVRRLGRRWGRSALGLVGFTGAGMCLAFFINDIAIPVIWAVGTDIGGRHAGTVSGFMNTLGALGGMISPIMIPVLKDNLPEAWSVASRWQFNFAVLAASWFVAAAAWLRIDAREKLFPEDEPAH